MYININKINRIPQIMQNKFYRLPNKVTMLGIILMLFSGLLTAIIAGSLYGYIDTINPFVYINFLLTLITGLTIGAAVSASAKVGKTTHLLLITTLTFISAVLAVYIENTVYVFVKVNSIVEIPFLSVVLKPHAVIEFLQIIAVQGLWSFRGFTPTGWELYAIWLIEAGIIIVPSIYLAKRKMTENSFCELDNQWMDKVVLIENLQALENVNLQQLQTQVYNDDISSLIKLKKNPPGATDQTILEFTECAICGSQKLLNIKTVQQVKRK